MNKNILKISTFLAALLMTACSVLDNRQILDPGEVSDFLTIELEPILGVDRCKIAMSQPEPKSISELDSSQIELLNWNIKKGERSKWEDDLSALASGKNLVLIQEATTRMGLLELLGDTEHFSFSPGYTTKNEITGVVTFSEVEPITQCHLVTFEPWGGTPKSTNITRYALTQSDHTLIVVNIHAINFSLGLADYRAQLDSIAEILADHPGPIIISGDFNTWRRGRHQALLEMIHTLKIEPISFKEDHRVTFFGSVLDHVFVGGLQVMGANVHPVQSSDHNPISISLRI